MVENKYMDATAHFSRYLDDFDINDEDDKKYYLIKGNYDNDEYEYHDNSNLPELPQGYYWINYAAITKDGYRVGPPVLKIGTPEGKIIDKVDFENYKFRHSRSIKGRSKRIGERVWQAAIDGFSPEEESDAGNMPGPLDQFLNKSTLTRAFRPVVDVVAEGAKNILRTATAPAEAAYAGLAQGNAEAFDYFGIPTWAHGDTTNADMWEVGNEAIGGYSHIRPALEAASVATLRPPLATLPSLSKIDKYRALNFSDLEAGYLAQEYNGMGHHFIPRRVGKALRIPDWYMESPWNKLKPNGITIGDMYELHAKVDPYFYGARLPKNIGKSWSSKRIGIQKYGLPGRLWHGSPTLLKATAALPVAVGGALYWFNEDD
jgi:hypothetical protein